MSKPTILRKRYIPDEIVDISGDELLHRSEELLVTRWIPIKPRADFSSGISYIFLKNSFKISRFLGADKELLYWYCDILDIRYDQEKDTYLLADLLVDMKVYPDGRVVVLDLDELAEALQKELISVEQTCRALATLDQLLKMAYGGQFPPKECRENRF